MRSLSFLLPALLLVAPPVSADDEAIDCAHASSTAEMNVCAEEGFDAADAKLNATYKKALAHVAERDLDPPFDRAGWEAALRASQRAWLAFRDADCKGAVPMEWSGGTGTTTAVFGCLTAKTRTRIEELVARYEIR